ncbi:olfactory receptor 13F1-like [Aquarana catesbeiana]|uniref:olfactory receptor 13F1-like n=1 Tax=Aquarana catesbeiana TaxID=8400 RepID=UPI003CCA41CC
MTHRRNKTIVVEVFFVGFESLTEYKAPFFLLLFLFYTFTCIDNSLIILLIWKSPHLHSPMYYLIANLLFCEVIYITNLVPPLMHSTLSGRWSMDFISCLVQINVTICITGFETFLLTLMSYDRYLAICQPLRYTTLIHNRLCLYFVIAFWMVSLAISLVIFYMLLSLVFCAPVAMEHFVCEYTAFFSFACIMSDRMPLIIFGLVVSTIINAPYLLILVSYIFIVISVLKIKSSAGRKKAFSTCGSHLLVVSIYFGIPFLASMVPGGTDYYNLMAAVYYGVPPLINPLIYSLRNQEIHKALQTAMSAIKQYFSGKISQ